MSARLILPPKPSARRAASVGCFARCRAWRCGRQGKGSGCVESFYPALVAGRGFPSPFSPFGEGRDQPVVSRVIRTTPASRARCCLRRARHPLPPVSRRARSAAGCFPSGFCCEHQCNVRLAQKATELLRCRKASLCAKGRHQELAIRSPRRRAAAWTAGCSAQAPWRS